MSRYGLRTRLGAIKDYNVLGRVFDGDALNLITAAGITDTTQQDAINDIFIDLKNYNLVNKIYALYLIVGGSTTEHKFNALNPTDTDAAFRLTFTGGITHASTGITFNGTTGYADTKLNISSSVSGWSNDHHLGIYLRTSQPSVGDGWHIGVGDTSNGNPIYGIAIKRFSSNSNDRIYDMGNVAGGNGRISDSYSSDGKGFWIGTSTASNVRKLYKNGVQELTSSLTVTGTPSNGNVHVGSTNPTAGSRFFLQGEMALISIGKGLSQTDVTNYNAAVQSFQGKLGRQV